MVGIPLYFSILTAINLVKLLESKRDILNMWGWVFLIVVFLVAVGVWKKNRDDQALTQLNNEVAIKASQVGVLPANFPYAQDVTQYCLSAARAGLTPDECQEFYEYIQINNSDLYPYIANYFPWFYNNAWPQYINAGWSGSTWWPGWRWGNSGWRGRNSGNWHRPGGRGRGWNPGHGSGGWNLGHGSGRGSGRGSGNGRGSIGSGGRGGFGGRGGSGISSGGRRR